MRRFKPSPFDGSPQYGGALQMPNVVSGVGKKPLKGRSNGKHKELPTA